MSAVPFSDDFWDRLDPEHQRLALARLHFLDFVQKLDLTRYPCRCPSGHPSDPVLDTGPQPDEQRKIVCGHCRRFVVWLPKLKNQNKRASSSTGLADSTVCQCCRKSGVNLVGHHLVEVQDGGSNDPDNLWTVCEPCHQIIHALRRHALGPFESVGEAQRPVEGGQ